MEIRTREGKVSEFIMGVSGDGVGHAISCLSVIENLCLAHARKGRRHAYALGKKGAWHRHAASESSRFLRVPSWLLKGRRSEGTKKKERKRAFKNERGSIPWITQRPLMAAEFPFPGTAVLCGLNGVDSHSRRATRSALFYLFYLFLENRTLSLRRNAIGSKCSQLPK